MARGKKGGSGRGTPRGGRSGRGGRSNTRGRGGYSSPVPATWQQAGFTLMEAARETSRHDHKSWGLNTLRTKPVTFISAGPSEPLQRLEDLLDHEEPAEAEDSPVQTQEMDVEDNVTSSGTTRQLDDSDTKRDKPQAKSPDEESTNLRVQDRSGPASFFFDTSRKGQTPAAQPQPAVVTNDRPSSRQSDSSDEVILFRGRDTRPKIEDGEQISMTNMRQEITVVEEQLEMKTETYEPLLVAEPRKKSKPGRRRDRRPPKKATSDDDALIADYIENMRENGEEDTLLQLIHNQQDIGGSDFIPSTENSDEEIEEAPNHNAEISHQTTDKDTGIERGQGSKDQYASESELDDETLAQLLAGHELGHNPNPFGEIDSMDSDSSADAQRWVDDLDVMDWDRPSLQREKGKGAKGRIRIEVSDSELEQTLQAAWKNDRFKKAERKRQREEMRALGQLGKNTKPEDLRVKYPQGMSLEEVAEEMRSFLQGTSETLALPPMDKHARKMIHDLANKFGIKSKSVGNQDNRRPTLNRTKRTQQYSAASFDQAVNRVNRKFFPRLDAHRSKGAPRTIGSGRVSMTAATVQDGEIVGAAAPELGIENRGRAMLEKMGWSKGTALGAMDNKGILQPVSQAMKRSKAGLG